MLTPLTVPLSELNILVVGKEDEVAGIVDDVVTDEEEADEDFEGIDHVGAVDNVV